MDATTPTTWAYLTESGAWVPCSAKSAAMIHDGREAGCTYPMVRLMDDTEVSK